MKILKKILLVVVIIIAVAAVAGMFIPGKLTMSRTVSIKGSQQVIFDQINILKNWSNWSPWQKMDPQINVTYSGPPSGVGAQYDWTSPNKNTGSGSMIITESIPYESITTDLDFKDNGKATSGYKLEKTGEEVKVTEWFETDMGNNPFKKLMMSTMGKSFMNKMFDQGLTDIKQIAESTPPVSETPTADSTIVAGN